MDRIETEHPIGTSRFDVTRFGSVGFTVRVLRTPTRVRPEPKRTELVRRWQVCGTTGRLVCSWHERIVPSAKV